MTKSRPSIKRRIVFYVPGFDPMPPRRYRELYRREGAKQAAISGYSLRQGAARDKEPSKWCVEFQDGDKTATSEFECLVWSDIVKSAMVPSFWNIFIKSFWYYAAYITSGALFRMMGIRLGPTIVALYPPVLTGLQVFIGIGLVLALWSVISGIAGVIIALILFALWLLLMRRIDRVLYAHYLMLDYAFYAQDGGRTPCVLKDRVDEFSTKVIDALLSDADEVLLVGHSSGALLAVSIAAAVGRALDDHPKPLGLLTLGHSVPMITFLPEAQDSRRDLMEVSQAPDITWLDVSAPGDGACFALTDPVAISGVAGSQQRHPKVITANFSSTLSQSQKDALKFRFFKKHFQYLCAFERPGQYDYFKLTSGITAFTEQVALLRESPSKVTTSFSGYTDV